MRYNTHQVDAATVERVQKNGREYLSFPLVPLREMVLNYPEHGTDEYLPAEKINASAPAWAGTPLTFKHPPNRGDGQTARTPEAYTDEVFGQFHEPTALDGGSKLNGTGLIDVEKANALGGTAKKVVDRLDAGETVSVSAGYGTIGDQSDDGTFDGENYNLVQGDLVPDHIAVFPPDEYNARCSPEEGCAAPRVNATRDDTNPMEPTDDPPDPSAIRRVLNYLNLNDESETHEHEECGCGGDCDECSAKTNTSDEEPDEGDDPDDDESEADNDDDDTMTDNDDPTLEGRAAELEETTAFSAEQLADMTDDQLDAIAPAGDEGGDETEEEETSDEPSDDETEETADEEVDIDARVEAKFEEMLEARQTSEQVDRDAEIVANATDIPREAAETMDPEKLSSLAEQHRGSVEQKANYSAVPGQVDRTNYDDEEVETDGISAGSYSDFKARQEDN